MDVGGYNQPEAQISYVLDVICVTTNIKCSPLFTKGPGDGDQIL